MDNICDRFWQMKFFLINNLSAFNDIYCNGIIVNDDRISIEFPDGRIADYEIHSDDYHFIKIL